MARLKKKFIHVNQHKIRANKKNGTSDPVLTVKVGKKNCYGHECEILGPSRVVYAGEQCGATHKPLSCGARVWIETTERVVLDGQDVEDEFETQSPGTRNAAIV